MKPFIYIKTFESFISKKISVNPEDTKYITGSLDFEEQYGVPDIKYNQIVFIGEINKIWTHGDFFSLSEDDIIDIILGANFANTEDYNNLLKRIERIEKILDIAGIENSDDNSTEEGIEIGN